MPTSLLGYRYEEPFLMKILDGFDLMLNEIGSMCSLMISSCYSPTLVSFSLASRLGGLPQTTNWLRSFSDQCGFKMDAFPIVGTCSPASSRSPIPRGCLFAKNRTSL